MDHAEKELEDIENFDKKLAEQKEADARRNAELEEKQRKENKRAPHLVNLNEDP